MSLAFLLEIGTEEIPDWMIPGALAQLAAKLDLFGATPSASMRRRAAWCCAPKACRSARRIASRSSRARRNRAGDKAADGFRQEAGRRTPRRIDARQANYYELRQEDRRAAPCATFWPKSLPAAILGIQCPKTMYWTGGKSGPRFIRPIRWIVALLGDEVIPFEIAGVKTGNVTRGHRQSGSLVDSGHHRELRKRTAQELRDPLRATSAATRSRRKSRRWARSSTRDLLETLTYHHRISHPDPRRLRSGVSGTARRSADHRDAAPPEVFLGRRPRPASSRRTSSR